MAVSVYLIFGICLSSCSDNPEKIYQERVEKATELYNSIYKTTKSIDEIHQKYIASLTSKVEAGTFSEEDETAAFDTMFADIDKILKSIDLYNLCDTLNNGILEYQPGFDKWPEELKTKAKNIDAIIGELQNVGYRISGFNERDSKWDHYPWVNLNSPDYHNLRNLSDMMEKIDNAGHELEKVAPGAYKALPNHKTQADKINAKAIKYFTGDGVIQDREKAFELFTDAAKLGQPHSMYCLGVIAQDSDAELAKKWYRKAAIAGSTQAMVELAKSYCGILYKEDHTTKSNEEWLKAKKWYQRAANFADPEALYLMGMTYTFGWFDVDKDEDMAKIYYQIGIVCHDAKCANAMGSLQKDKNEQAKYYRMALQFDPECEMAKENLRQLNAGL